MANLFRAYGVRNTVVPTYFIESTAPDNVDALPPMGPVPSRLFLIERPREAIKEIARHLSGADDPNLVVMVHGFNNPQPAVLDLYRRAAIAIHDDNEIAKDKGLVCVGYRWPSEKMGTPMAKLSSALAVVADVDILVRRHIWRLTASRAIEARELAPKLDHPTCSSIGGH